MAPRTSSRVEPPEHPWVEAVEQVLDRLGVNKDEGLGEQEVDSRREEFGSNELSEFERRSVWKILWDQVASLIMVLLVAAMIVSLATGQLAEGMAVAAVIVINTAIGFVTEWRARRSMESLQELGQVEARLRRGGQEVVCPAEEIVPGDIVLVESGDIVAADMRVVEASGLEVDESALTGESAPVSKKTEPLEGDEIELAERANMLWRGTVITRGEGEAVVVETGMDTQIGEISEMVEQAEQSQTPIEQKLDALGRKLVWVTLGVAALVTISGVIAGRELALMIETGIALAVAAIPEGLPIVATVALAYGVWKMYKHNALMRQLSSVQTLGATTLICTDKTGTLTRNEMTVTHLATQEDAERELAAEEDSEGVELDERERALVLVGALCNDAKRGGAEPMEEALLELAERAGLDPEELHARWERVEEVPFDREIKMMATFHEDPEQGGYLVAVKGAPEAVLEASQVDDELRQRWEERNEEMARQGLRVLALAQRRVEQPQGVEQLEGLELLGLVGLLDPPREGVEQVISRCHDAGVRVVMVTGDHPATALAIGRAVGIVGEDEERSDEELAVRGSDFVDPDQASDSELAAIRRAAIFARVSPEQKLDLIGAHQAGGEIVAMTGDGVNDAPALRSADIGVAMGEQGTQVARDAADMVLLDDELSTVLVAIERGRVIFENIRKFVIYLLSGNVGEIIAVGGAAVAGWALPLLPLQILYLNMLNDVFPALALGLGGGTEALMERPPRDPEEDVITRAGWIAILAWGVLIATTTLGAFWVGYGWLGMSEEGAVTISFLSLSIGRLLHVFNMRDEDSGIFVNEISRNPFVWGALVLCVALLCVAVYVEPLAELLSVQPLGLAGWGVVVGASVAVLLAGQIALLILRAMGDDEDQGADRVEASRHGEIAREAEGEEAGAQTQST